MIEIKNVTLNYIKEYTMLNNINLIANENTLILGSKNDGTHSLMRIISKIDSNYAGNIMIDGKDIKYIKDKDFDLAYVSSDPYLFNYRSIFYNLYYPLKIRKIKKKDINQHINEIIEKYLKEFPKKIKNMSTGVKKIITLLRVMIRRPKYVLIEDLFSNLDDNLISKAIDILNELSKSSIIIACDEIDKYYYNYKKYTLSYGSLQLISS